MNILPKKRWHVRTKDNIARVRRDEAEAKEQERKRQEKLLLAESEARINFLRKKSRLDHNDHEEIKTSPEKLAEELTEKDINNDQHVNFFANYKSHIKNTNKALEDEKKEEREKYEKQIGYLTYLGQDTNESLKVRSWYESAPKRLKNVEDTTVEKDLKHKRSQDPLTLINSLLPAPNLSIKSNNTEPTKTNEDCNSVTNNINKTKKRNRECKEVNYKKHKEIKKHKKTKKHKKHKHKRKKCELEESDFEERHRLCQIKLEKLRVERLIREANERARQEALLAPTEIKQNTQTKIIQTAKITQKYNSQFNPEIAKQNIM